MFEDETFITADLHWDEVPFMRPYEDTEDEFEENTMELPLAEKEELTGKPIDPTDVPEPLALLAKRAEVKETVQQVVKEIPNMPCTDPFDTPEPMGALAMMAGVAEEDTLFLEDAWFKEEPKYETPAVVLETPKKKTWFARIMGKVDRAVEKFGNFLDTAVPVAAAGALAFTLGSFGSVISAQTKPSEAPAPVQTAAVAKAEIPLVKPTTVEVKQTSQAEKNQRLIEKNVEIVQNAGGEKARYLHSEASHQDFVAQLEKWGGFRAILEHPKVKESKTTAQMINLVDEYFGEKVADLVESNAAAMHLPTALSV